MLWFSFNSMLIKYFTVVGLSFLTTGKFIAKLQRAHPCDFYKNLETQKSQTSF